MLKKKFKRKRKTGGYQYTITIFKYPKEFNITSLDNYKIHDILIKDKTIIDNIRILYENNEQYTHNSDISYIKNIYVFKQLISDKYTLDLSDINTDNNTLIFSYIINNIINNINRYITDTTIIFNIGVKIHDNLNYFNNIKYNIKKIIDIINNYIRYNNNKKITIDTYDINILISNYFIDNDYWIKPQLNSKDFNKILLDIFIKYILNLTRNPSNPIYINFGTIVQFKINELVNDSNIRTVIYLHNDKIIFNLKIYLDIYLSTNKSLYNTNLYIKNFIDDINELDNRINRDNIIDIDDIIINKNNERIDIQFLSIYINIFKNKEQENDINIIIKQLESLIINSESIDKPYNYIDNYYDKNFGQEKPYSTKEEVYINIPTDLYKENIKILIENIACKKIYIAEKELYRVDTKSTFINIIINELEKQKIYYTKYDILEFLKTDSNDYIIIKKTINNIILFILLEIIINTYYNKITDIYDNIIYLYIFIDIYKSLVFTTDSNIIDLKKTLGKYLYNKYYNNYNYIVLYSNNNEDENYDIIYIYKEDVVLLQDDNNNIINIDLTLKKYFENFKSRLNNILLSDLYLSNVLNKDDTSDSKINLNSKITDSIISIGIAGGAGNEFLNIYVNDGEQQVIQSNDKITNKKFFIKDIIDKEDNGVTQLNREIADSNDRKQILESEITTNINKSKNISDFKFNISSGFIDSTQLIELKNTLKRYSDEYHHYLKLYTDTKKKIEKIEKSEKSEKSEKPEIDDKIKNLLDEIKEIKKLDEIKEILKLSFQGNQYIIDLINDYDNIDKIKELLNFPVFDVNNKKIFHESLLNIYINSKIKDTNTLLNQIDEIKNIKKELKENADKLNKKLFIKVYDKTDIINIFLSIVNLVKNRLHTVHSIDIIDDDIMKNQNVIYKQNSNWIINLSKVIINTERRIKSGVAKKPGMISIISTGISTGISKINPFKNKKETSIDKYIIQETIDDKPKLYLTIGPPLLLRTQYLEKGGYSKHNYIIEKSSINKKGGRISENNYNTAAYKIAVKLFKLTDSNKISFVFRETTKNSDKNSYKYKAELKINKKINKKEIKLKEISNKKKI